MSACWATRPQEAGGGDQDRSAFVLSLYVPLLRLCVDAIEKWIRSASVQQVTQKTLARPGGQRTDQIKIHVNHSSNLTVSVVPSPCSA